MKDHFKKTLANFVLLTGCISFVLSFSSASADVIDAPHNDTNNIKCTDCHNYSLWWTHSPAASSPSYSQIADDVCNKCHAQAGYPNKLPHSASTMSAAPVDMHNVLTGDWSTKCVDCHDPHFQAQMNWLDGTDTTSPVPAEDVYLATGTVDTAVAFTNGTGANNTVTTTFSYLGAAADDNWLDPLSWDDKNSAGNGRGLILVLRTGTRDATFEINSATGNIITSGTADGAGSITVQGSIPAHLQSGEFGIIYGQLVKDIIATPNGTVRGTDRPVKFFDATIPGEGAGGTQQTVGGFVDRVNAVPEGICQVCHTLTDYWLEDGSLIQPDQTRFGLNVPTSHNETALCTDCHVTANGFKPLYADHSFISGTGTSCISCHDGANIVLDVHNSMCADCHTAPPALVSPFPSTKWPTITPPINTGICYDCHGSIQTAFISHPNAENHNGQVTASPTCVTACHFHNNRPIIRDINSQVTGIHEATGNPCEKCHNLTKVSTDPDPEVYTGDGALKSIAVNGPGDCTNCHGSNVFGKPENGAPIHAATADDHTGQVTDTNSQFCRQCHDSADLIGGTRTHNGSCGACHNTGDSYALQSLAAANGPGSCVDCHGSDFYMHDINNFTTFDHEDYGAVTADAYCVGCHTETDQNGNDYITIGIHTINGCATCHNPDATFVASIPVAAQSGHGYNDLGNLAPANTCSSCHTDKATNHPTHDDTVAIELTPVDRCVSCHAGNRVDVVHNGNCNICHVNTTERSQFKNLKLGVISNATCVTCHDNYNNVMNPTIPVTASFYGHQNIASHTGQVDALDPSLVVPDQSQDCLSCHLLDPVNPQPAQDAHWRLICATCHNTQPGGALEGYLFGSASGKETGKPPVDYNYCTDCHSHDKYKDGARHNSVYQE